MSRLSRFIHFYTDEYDGVPVPSPVEKTVKGSIVSISDALAAPLRSLLVNIDPVQDLHGYDNPWPAGGGSNILAPQTFSSSGSGVDITSTADGGIKINGTASAYKQSVAEENIELVSGTYVLAVSGTAVSGANIQLRSLDGLTTYAVCALGGNQSFTLAETTTMKMRCVLNNGTVIDQTVYPQIIKGSTAPTAWTPYSNICPISGHTEVNVWRTGINVWDEEWEVGDISTSGFPITGNFVRSKNFIAVKPETTYYWFDPNNTQGRVFYYDASQTYISYSFTSYSKFTTPANAYYVKFRAGVAYGTTYKHDISINYPATDTQYHPYSGNQYTIQLGQTVYGGTLDVTNGVLTVDRAMVDLGTLSWFRTTSYAHPIFYSNIENAAMNGNQICSILKNVGGTSGAASFSQIAPDCSFSNCIANTQVFVRYDIYTTTADFKTAMSGVQLVYELATPITYQLTPQEIQTLKGLNNIWADTGDVTVTYLADGNASDEEAVNILLGMSYSRNTEIPDDATDSEALNILLGGAK